MHDEHTTQPLDVTLNSSAMFALFHALTAQTVGKFASTACKISRRIYQPLASARETGRPRPHCGCVSLLLLRNQGEHVVLRHGFVVLIDDFGIPADLAVLIGLTRGDALGGQRDLERIPW